MYVSANQNQRSLVLGWTLSKFLTNTFVIVSSTRKKKQSGLLIQEVPKLSEVFFLFSSGKTFSFSEDNHGEREWEH